MVTRSLRNFLVVFALSFVSVPAAADAIVPGALAAVEGNINNGFPFNAGAFSGDSSMRYQQVYAASEFGPDALYIDAILFRPDRDTGDAFASFYPNVQVNLSTTQRGPDSLFSTFADNIGADDTVARSDSLVLTSLDVAGPGSTREFDILIPFTTSFLYNPALGNLLLDVRVSSNPGSTQFDAQSVFGDSVSRVFARGVDTATAGFADTAGLVTKFQTSAINAVPDPASTLGLFLMGIGSLFAVRRRYRGL